MKTLTHLFFFCVIAIHASAQDRSYRSSFISVGGSYLELKDQYNHGLVFRGPDVSFSYGLQQRDDRKYYEYACLIAAGGKTTLDTWGFRWLLTPVKAHMSWNVLENANYPLFIGPSFRINYNVQNYPELHAGPIFWMANYDIGIHLSSFFNLRDHLLGIQFKTSAFGWMSRPEMDRDPYYFSTAIGENFADIHRNMLFGSTNRYSETTLSLDFHLGGKRRNRVLSYVFTNAAYYDQPRFEELSHSLQFTWYLKPANP